MLSLGNRPHFGSRECRFPDQLCNENESKRTYVMMKNPPFRLKPILRSCAGLKILQGCNRGYDTGQVDDPLLVLAGGRHLSVGFPFTFYSVSSVP